MEILAKKYLFILSSRKNDLYLAALRAEPDQPACLLARLRQRAGAVTDKAALARGIAQHQGVRRHIARYHSASPHQGKCPDRHPAANHRSTSNRGPILYQRWRNRPVIRAFERTVRGNRAWKKIICKTDMRTYEHTIFQCYSLENRRMVLDFHLRANLHVSIDIHSLANVAVSTDHRVLAYVRLAPDACPHAHRSLRRNLRRRMDIDSRLTHSVSPQNEPSLSSIRHPPYVPGSR